MTVNYPQVFTVTGDLVEPEQLNAYMVSYIEQNFEALAQAWWLKKFDEPWQAEQERIEKLWIQTRWNVDTPKTTFTEYAPHGEGPDRTYSWVFDQEKGREVWLEDLNE